MVPVLVPVLVQGQVLVQGRVLVGDQDQQLELKTHEICLNKAKWFAKQLASLVYQCKATVLEFPSKKSDTLSETIPKNTLSPLT